MTILDLRREMWKAQRDGVPVNGLHATLEADDITIKSGELFVNKKQFFAFPEGYKSNIMKKQQAKDFRFFNARYLQNNDWRMNPEGQNVLN